MKNLIVLTLIGILWGCVSQVKAQDLTQRSNQWVLFKEVKGVQFFIRHKQSRYDRKLNTMVRLRNVNGSEKNVSFTPAFTCLENEDISKVIQRKVNVVIRARHSITLLAYRPCKGDVPIEIFIENIRIR